MRYLTVVALAVLAFTTPLDAGNKTHLFILSGQSNMARLDPALSFTPAVEAAFGKEHVVVVKDAQSGQPIRRWYKKWSELSSELTNTIPPKKVAADLPEKHGDLYDRMMVKVNKAIAGKMPDTITFVWMQGECDAKEGNESIYGRALLGVIKQMSDDLKRDDINFVIGRLSQYSKNVHWDGLRKVQVEVAESSPHGGWVDTDDVETKGIHYTNEGSKDLGKRFADKAINLIKE